MIQVARCLLSLPLVAALALPALAQGAPVALARPFTSSLNTIHASDDAFEPRPAEALDSPWRGRDADLQDDLGDGRRTLSRFGKNLGRNLVGVVSRDNLEPLLFGAAAGGVASFFDQRTERYFGAEPRWPVLGRTGQQLGEPRNLAIVATALFASGRVSRDARFRAASYDIAQAFVVNGVWTGALKFAVRRERPDHSSRMSFPSGHASNAFAWATVAEHHYGPKVGVPAYVVAGLVGVSRIEKNVHHLSDVVAGAALGYVVGRTVVREDGGPVGRGRRFTLAPIAGPDGHGVGLAFQAQF